ncbi:substrate-binding periplasmic protein [Rhizobium johnstonii]|uniref:substrate-binding periplasmic protein n=1 Tax=Rhizobium johnstonii TaxID=3019933 RepID=UPI003F9AABE2
MCRPWGAIFAIGLFLMAEGAGGQQTPSQPRAGLTVAVRNDARPFIWKDEDTNQYLGFFWDVCRMAIERAGFQMGDEIALDADQRRDFLNNGVAAIDLLCDPTTLTLKRMKNFTEVPRLRALTFSPIVFMANGSFITQNFNKVGHGGWGPLPPGVDGNICDVLLARAGTAILPKKDDIEGEKHWITMFDRPKTNFEIWGFLDGSTIGDELRRELAVQSIDQKGRPTICLKDFTSHTEAAIWFCEGRLARYFGDTEIVRASIEARIEIPGSNCVSQPQYSADGTYEPYAFVLSSERFPEFPKEFSYALYEMFSDGTMERLYMGHFKKAKSDSLRTLFQINAVPKGTPSDPKK